MCIPKTSSLDVHILRCPCCKLNNLPKCPHIRATCPNQTNHPRFHVVYFKTDLQTFSGCGYCKFARRHPFSSDGEAAQRNHGWPGCCRSPRADDIPDLDLLTDWPAIAAFNSISLPKSVAEALAKAGHSLTYLATNSDHNLNPRHPHAATRSATTTTTTTTRVGGGGALAIGTSPGPALLKDTHRTTDTDHSRDHHSNHSNLGRVSPHRRTVNPFNPRAASPTSTSNTHDQPNHSPTSPRSTTSSGSGSSHSSNSISPSSRKLDRSIRDRDRERDRERDRDRDRDRDRNPDSTMASTRHSQDKDNSPKGASDPNVNIREKHASWSPIREKGPTTSQNQRKSDERSREYERGKEYQYSVGRKLQPQQMHPIVTISKATAPQAFSKSSRPSLPSCQRQELYTKPPLAQAVPASAPPTASMRRLASVADTTYQRDPISSVPLPRTTRAQAPSLTAMMADMSVDAAYPAYPSRFPVNHSASNNNNIHLPPPESMIPPRPPNPSPPASQTSSNSSNSSAQEGTVISDGAFTDYLSDDSDVELSRQAEEKAERQYQEALVRAEEQEFRDARELLLATPMSTSPNGPTSRSGPTAVDDKRYFQHSIRAHAALPQAPQGYSIAGYTRR